MATKKVIHQKYVYDPYTGRDVREMKPTRTFSLMTASTVTNTSPFTIASTVVGTNQNIMVTGFSAGLIDGNGTGIAGIPSVSLVEGSSSIASIVLLTSTADGAAQPWKNIVTTADAPLLYSVGTGASGGTRTIAIYASTNGTYNAGIWGRIEPILSKVEI